MVRIAPSILSADFAALGADINSIAEQTDWLHVDVMDGHFVPNLTIGPPVVAAIRHHTELPLDCHLMMTNPGDYLEAFRKAGADRCSVHIEVGNTSELFKEMRSLGLGVGLAINPETPFEAVEGWLGQIDLLLVMTVHPGFGGQSFMSEVVPKLATARQAIASAGYDAIIEVDGGIDADTAAITARAGAEVFVAGSAIFGTDDPMAAAAELRRSAEVARQGTA